MFTGDEIESACEMLRDECLCDGVKDPADLDRIRIAALKISDGTLDGLVDALVLVQTDWRDALMAADFGSDLCAHEHWWPE